MEKVSIIIPVYNTEKYLKKCIDSILKQTYNNIEILIVDDGSTDKSAQICDTYINSDNVKVVHTKHQGTSFARNIGLDMVTSNYVCFIDSDDYVENDFIEILYNQITTNNADIAACAFDYVAFNTSKSHIPKKDKQCIFNSHEALIKMCDFNEAFSCICCNKIYKMTLFNNLKFPENKMHEDLYLNIELLKKANKIAYYSTIKYHYCTERKESTSNSAYKSNEYDGIEHCNKLVKLMKEEYNEDNVIVQGFYLANLIEICNKLIDIGAKKDKIFQETQCFARSQIFRLLKSNYMLPRKINAICFSINYRLYILYYKFKRNIWKRK